MSRLPLRSAVICILMYRLWLCSWHPNNVCHAKEVGQIIERDQICILTDICFQGMFIINYLGLYWPIMHNCHIPFLFLYSIISYLADKENLCLYGLPNEQWEVTLPAEEVPPELPEPALGINFARDGMQDKDWLSLVAVHSDAWLLSVAFYFGARFGFDKTER